jgi:hypothetical protein
MNTRIFLLGVAAALVLAGCGGPADVGTPEPDREPGEGAIEEPGEAPPESWPGFDREASRAEAEALLGLQEDEVEESPERRIVRRGDERFVVTMDLRPGRKNVELDDDGTGTYVVTRVVVEVPDGEDDLVVE